MKKKKRNEKPWIETLCTAMEAAGFNPYKLSVKAGLGATAVRDILEGRAKYPRYDTVVALAHALGTTPAQLMGEEQVAKALDPLGDAEIDRLAEIVACAHEAVMACPQNVSSDAFAAMVVSLYRCLPPGGKEALTDSINSLVMYEVERHRRQRTRG